ncbi:DUF2357 domain-containing protein [bacterium]|nr:DUF2357 domain-containing protein [bacterium]
MSHVETTIDSIEQLYLSLNRLDETGSQARLQLFLRGWLTDVSSFDPRTSEILPIGFDNLLENIITHVHAQEEDREVKDRVYRIVKHVDDAVYAVTENMRAKILREHVMMPIHAAREVDSKTVQWLSRKPGRNLREKLAGKPYIKAVHRRSSLDTPENRLFKAFLEKLEGILVERHKALPARAGDTCLDFLTLMQRWLHKKEASETGSWGNHPPNNALLQDKRYRKVWDGWLWLQSLDNDLAIDQRRLDLDVTLVVYWNILALLKETGHFRTVQQPVRVDYDRFQVVPALTITGYIMPTFRSTRDGIVKAVNHEKYFGFIKTEGPDLFFHKSNISNDLTFADITVGDHVFFELGKGRKGDCADNIRRVPFPLRLDFMVSSEQILIDFPKGRISIHVNSNHVSVMKSPAGYSGQFNLGSSTCSSIATKVTDLLLHEFSLNDVEIADSELPEADADLGAIDLCDIRPSYAIATGSQNKLPIRLLLQNWRLESGDITTVDCGLSTAISVDEDVENIGMPCLFSSERGLSDSSKSSASRQFFEGIKRYLKVDTLYYLVPDWANDFDLEPIRKSANSSYENSAPLPKSIAAIFNWQASKQFRPDLFRSSSYILVLDAFAGGISITPVEGIYDENLADFQPETSGFYWERHPTSVLRDDTQVNKTVDGISRDGCPRADYVIDIFGYGGLSSEAGNISLVSGNEWYHVPDSMESVFSRSALDSRLLDQCRNVLQSVSGYSPKSTVFILPANKFIEKPLNLSSFHWIDSDLDLCDGAITLSEWQDISGDIPLWKDHLPELSVQIVRDGFYKNFSLVENATVTPQRGQQVSIPVNELFTLPAGNIHYSFPLFQGSGKNELQFVAYLKSPAFPLREDTLCRLQMNYRYGIDVPYDLRFIAVEPAKAGFTNIRVEWRPIADIPPVDISLLPIPIFPPKRKWSDFQRFPKENSSESSDLLELCISTLEELRGLVSLDGGMELDDQKTQRYFKRAERSIYRLRLPALIIWSNEHSLSEADVPNSFRNSIFEGIGTALAIYESNNLPKSLVDGIFFFLCCLHRDAPIEVADRLIEISKNTSLFRRYSRHIALAIGAAELPWQRDLLKNAIELVDDKEPDRSITMVNLSIVLWRSEKVIYSLTYSQLGNIFVNLLDCIKLGHSRIVSGAIGEQVAILCRHLELLLALFRTRSFDDRDVQGLILPGSGLSESYMALIEEISRTLSDKDIELHSRINLQIDKPKIFHRTPDLLYALRVYLTGDSGANTIVISGISDTE